VMWIFVCDYCSKDTGISFSPMSACIIMSFRATVMEKLLIGTTIVYSGI